MGAAMTSKHDPLCCSCCWRSSGVGSCVPLSPIFLLLLFFYSCVDAMKQLLAILEAMKENFLLSKEKYVKSIL
jgi:hypothetical protein